MAIKLSGNDVTFGENTVSQSGQRLLTKSGIRGIGLTGSRVTGFHWNGHRFPPPPADCVLYLPGYPAQGSTIQDFSGQGNNGTITGATWKRLPSGLWYLDFDGNDDYITLGSASVLNFTSGDFSILAWINIDSTGNSQQHIFGRGLDTTDGYSFWINGVPGTAQLYFRTSQAAADQDSFGDAGTLPLDGWLLVGVSRSGATATLYQNGAEPAQTKQALTDPLTSARDARIGIWDDVASRPYKGGIFPPRVFNVALSSDQHKGFYVSERHLFGV